MTSLDIKINTKNLRYYSKSLNLTISDLTLSSMIESFPNYIRRIYLDLIKNEMNSPRYKGSWEPVKEKGYLEYLGVSPCDDIFHHIAEALQIEKKGIYYLISFDPRYKYPESSLPLLKVLRAIESGTSEFPARPILVRCNRQISHHLRELWKEFLIRKELSDD